MKLSPTLLVLAAGKGSRLHSTVPKVLQILGEKPLLYTLLHTIAHAFPRPTTVGLVLGHGRSQIESYFKEEPWPSHLQITTLIQEKPQGTGDAVIAALNSDWGRQQLKTQHPFLILPGDLPFLSPELLQQFSRLPLQAPVRLLTTQMPQPQGYGRVITHPQTGQVLKIVEEQQATPEERRLQTVATSLYFCQADWLESVSKTFQVDPVSHEIYLTQLIELTHAHSLPIENFTWPHPEDLLGVNTYWELAQAETQYYQRIVKFWALKGVRILDPRSIRIGSEVQLGQGVILHPQVQLLGKTLIGNQVEIQTGVQLKDVVVHDHALIKTGTLVEQSTIGQGSQLGPYAILRAGCTLKEKVRIGNFVELKNSHIGTDTKIAHLSYLGDAQVGERVNIGCGFVTCNFSGKKVNGSWKHPTVIESDVFIGSDCQAIAPIRIGEKAYIASGSTLPEDVPAGALAIARSRPTLKLNYASRLRSSRHELSES